jgi:Ferredoxin-dependent bilin reductase
MVACTISIMNRVVVLMYLLTPQIVCAWVTLPSTTTPSTKRAFGGSHLSAVASPTTMYVDSASINIHKIPNSYSSRTEELKIPIHLETASPQPIRTRPSPKTVSRKTSTHWMPWKKSISKQYNEPSLFYMPFWEWQMSFMNEHLTELRALPVVSRSGRDMSYVETANATMRMHTSLFTCEEYKSIRCTVLDGGHQVQVFTSLWYPNEDSLQPVLGIDLLQFNHGKKHLCIVDFQPVTKEKQYSEVANNFEHLLEPIRNQYPSLQGEMTDRFYHPDDSFFSKQMLLGRHNQRDEPFTAQSMVYDDLFPAYQQYLKTHVQLVQTDRKSGANTPNREVVAACHEAYDTYSAARDPAHALLGRLFGQEWADEYVYDILFPSATRVQ